MPEYRFPIDEKSAPSNLVGVLLIAVIAYIFDVPIMIICLGIIFFAVVGIWKAITKPPVVAEPIKAPDYDDSTIVTESIKVYNFDDLTVNGKPIIEPDVSIEPIIPIEPAVSIEPTIPIEPIVPIIPIRPIVPEQDILDAISALRNLGTRKKDAKEAVMAAVENGAITLEEVIKQSLQNLNSKK